MLPPTVRLRAGVVGINQNLLASTLINVVSDDAPVTLYEIKDNGTGGGYFQLNGVRQNAGSFFRVTPSQLPSLIYRGATSGVGETFTVRATNSFGVSAERTAGITTGNSRPVIAAQGGRVRAGEEISLAGLLSYSDVDGDQARTYGFVDRSFGAGSGQLFLNGVAQAQANWFFVPAADLSRVSYRGGSIGGRVENLGVMVSDGVSFSDVTDFSVRTQGKPVVTADRTSTVRPGERVAASDLFNVTDPDGDAISLYYIVDRLSHASSGYFEFKGQRQPDARFIRVPANELNQLVYVAGDGTIQTENIGVIAYDGSEFSDVANLPVSFPPSTPVSVTGTNTTLDAGQATPISSLLNISGAGGEPVSRYWLVDRSHGNDGGYFEVNGARVPSARFFTVDGNQIDSVVYRGGTINETENIGVQVLVGSRLSTISDFQITTQNDDPVVEPVIPPQLELIDVAGRIGTVFELTELYRTSDQFERFGLVDADSSPDSGYFSVDGINQANGSSLLLDADQVNSVRYHLGSAASSEEFRMFIFDGSANSAIESATATTFFAPEIQAVQNSISLDTLEQVSLADNFQKVDAGPDYTIYQVFDERDTLTDGPISTEDRSARLVRNGLNLTRGVVQEFTAAEFAEIVIQGAEVDFGRSIDPILVRASSGDGVFTEWERINVNTDPIGAESLEVLQMDPDTMEMVPISMPGLSDIPGATGKAGQTVITYTFIDGGNQEGGGSPPTPAYSTEEDDALALNQAQRESIRQSLANIETFVNVQFVERPYEVTATESQITFGAADLDDTVGAYAYFPPTLEQQNPPPVLDEDGNPLVDEEGNFVDEDGNLLVPNDGRGTIQGDIWYNSDFYDPRVQGNYELGSEFFLTTLHELGHALGLKHPFDGTPSLSIFNNFSYNTVMAYQSDNVFNPRDNPHPEFPSSLMLYDIVQLQSTDAYGPNPDYKNGDDVYTYPVSHQQVLYDTGGIDTIDMSNHLVSEIVDLREGQWSTVQGVNQSVLIFYGTVIENASTGTGNDSIRGNEIANSLSGGSGADLLRGGGDNDQLFGGRGNDTYQWFLGDGRDTIREQGLGGTDVLEIHDASDRLDALEDDLYFRRLGDDLRIDLRLDQGEGIGTVLVKDFAQSGSAVETLRLFNSTGIQIGDDIDLNSVFTTVDSFGGRYEATVRQGANGVIAIPSTPVV